MQIKTISFKDKIAILGFGVEGRAMYDFLRKYGYTDITICDLNDSLAVEDDSAYFKLGVNYLDNMAEFDVVFRSPGIRYSMSEIKQAIESGTRVTSVTKFFFEHCPCPIIGVTGTKGKGTTSTLIYEMFKGAKKDVYLGGNIGEPPINFLEKLNSQSFVILELSSFQLQDLKNSPQVGVVLNTTQDHLDWHGDKEEYWRAKTNLIKHQDRDDLTILNLDYKYSTYFARQTEAEIKYVSSVEATNGAYQLDEKMYYQKQPLLGVSEIALLGKHNWENIMPAIVVAKRFNISNEIIINSIKNFKGLPYRLELIREVDNIKFYNDSFSTNPETSIAGIKSFDEPLALVAGGYDKGLDYDEWARQLVLRANLKFIFLIGDLADKMELILNKYNQRDDLEIIKFNNFNSAVRDAYQKISQNNSGIVLLSPAAASFDMFVNYKDRGDKFVAAVNELVADGSDLDSPAKI